MHLGETALTHHVGDGLSCIGIELGRAECLEDLRPVLFAESLQEENTGLLNFHKKGHGFSLAGLHGKLQYDLDTLVAQVIGFRGQVDSDRRFPLSGENARAVRGLEGGILQVDLLQPDLRAVGRHAAVVIIVVRHERS